MNPEPTGGAPAPKLLDLLRRACRLRHYSIRTEQAYCAWARRYCRFHAGPDGAPRHPAEMGAPEVAAFLAHLATERRVAASTQNQALGALAFLYEAVLGEPLGDLGAVPRAKRPRKLPVVLSRAEVERVLGRLEGRYRLTGALLYGSGLHLMEALRLRIKDVDFELRQVVVRDGKGAKDRVTPLPDPIEDKLRRQAPSAPCSSTSATSRTATARSTSPTRWSGSTPRPPASRTGSTSFRRLVDRSTRGAGWCGATTSRPPRCRRRCGSRCDGRRSGSRPRATASATRSPRTCWSGGPTSARCRSSWGTLGVKTTMIYTHVLNRGSGVVSPLVGLGGFGGDPP